MPPASSKAWLKVPDWIRLLVANPLRQPTPQWLLLVVVGVLDPFKAWIHRDSGVPVLYYCTFFLLGVLGPSCYSTDTLALLSGVESSLQKSVNYTD